MFFTAMAAGGLLGTLCVSWLFDRFPRHQSLLLGVANVGVGITTAGIPCSVQYPLTIALCFVNQFISGGMETVGNTDMVATWGSESNMHLQFMHFTLAAGATVAPLILKPFLAKSQLQTPSDLTSNGTVFPCSISTEVGGSHSSMFFPNTSLMYNDTTVVLPLHNQTISCPEPPSLIRYAYLISGLMSVTAAVPFLVEACKTDKKSRPQPAQADQLARPTLPPRLRYPVFIFVGLFYLFTCAAGGSYIAYLATFCVKQRGWTRYLASLITTAFWGSLCLFRLIAVVLCKFLSPLTMMNVFQVTMLLSMLMAWVSVHLDSDAGLWVSVIGTGASISTLFASGISYVDGDVMPVTGRVTTVVMIGSNIAGIVNPVVMGHLLQEVSIMWFLYVPIIEHCAAFAAFLGLVLHSKTLIRNYIQKCSELTQAEVDLDTSVGKNTYEA
ncbi:sodium-dependent glucose transporter 1C-like [Haliotis rubra]|uniref:sodium-dependent glucose transporter 1C-like n=1 Tax=Haliotis rubra TaxID=36100 RepID=UPI001EE615B4|nr:sodium-dependent glucose transporter 1C-like [Haliotis rubra]